MSSLRYSVNSYNMQLHKYRVISSILWYNDKINPAHEWATEHNVRTQAN